MQRFILLLVLCYCYDGYSLFSTSDAICDALAGNGECDGISNTEECNWDGGDCCWLTCEGDSCPDNEPFSDCMDPDAQGYPGDGICDWLINDPDFDYDDGDCCPCTCSDCSENDCLDPAAPEQVYDCKDAPTALPTCVDEHTVDHEVENAAQARDLVAAINCSGGVFNVSWKGNIVLEETIWVVDGTILNVTGKGWDAEIDGNGVTRLFTVVNASLHISNMKISNGDATGGGAIGASGSTLTFHNTGFTGNTASRDGGAILATEDTSILFDGETFFINNTASSGGALYITDVRSASWEGNTSFVGNDGGALIVKNGSMVSWAAEVMFSRQKGDAALILQDSTASWTNQAIFSGNIQGALIVEESSSVSWTKETKFLSNIAYKGGALSVEGDSDVWWDGTTFFSNNTGDETGGAIYVDGTSNVTWTAGTTFDNNIASNGGALSVEGGSDISWNAATFFSRNTASEEGGAIYVDGTSSVTWTANTTFDDNNASNGGALSIEGGSDISWNAATLFSRNVASDNGGAIYVDGSSSVTWTANTTFDNNNASNGGALSIEGDSDISWKAATFFSRNIASDEGGAIYVDQGCNASWTEETYFSANNASSGGALYVEGGSRIDWISDTNFSSNTATAGGGGAIYVGDDVEVAWAGKTIFSDNDAYDLGGAIVVVGGSISWDSSTLFLSNSLRLKKEGSGRGGALYIGDSSNVSWTGKTVFEDNSAGERGGGIFIALSSTLKWSGETNFTSNSAGLYGGAVGSDDLSLTADGDGGQPSSLNISSATHFLNNTCEGSGGGMALLRMLDFTLSTDDEIIFKGNSATTSGGGVYISGIETGPKLFGMRFVSNFASSGGGLYAVGSHTEIIESCFIDNFAESGGAIHSFSGVDSLLNSEFRGNIALVGGALTLIGQASMVNCSFLENTSGMDGGPAIYSTLGSFQDFKNCSFLDNIFKCDAGKYFSFKGEGHKNEIVCYECGECDTCDYGDPDSIPTCEPGLPHTTSDGGTIEKLVIDRGYWRATNVSTYILKCFNDAVCNGGVTDDPGFCEGGYEGAYCSVCAKSYTSRLGQTCTKCSDPKGGIILAIVLTVLGIIVGVIIILHLVSGETGGARSLVDRITRKTPRHTLKIVIVTWQILTQFAEVAHVTYPDVYQGFLNAINWVNFDLSRVLSLECLVNVDFHGKMLFATTGPIVLMGILGTTYMIAARRHRGSTEALRKVWHKHLSMCLLLTSLVYSNASSVLIQMFGCDKLDDGNIYLRADYNIYCDSDRHRSLMVYSTIMVLIYPVGIPVLYIYLLFSNRTVLMDGIRRETDESVQSTTDLWKPYRPSRFYYEVIECVRRLLLTVGVSLIDDDTTAQISVIFMLAVCFALLLEILAPYKSIIDVWVSRTGHAVVYGSMYFALLLKTEISNDSPASQKAFKLVLITMQVILIVLVVINTVVLSYSSSGKNRVDARGKVAPRENFAGLVVSNRHMITRVRALSNPRRQMLVVHPS